MGAYILRVWAFYPVQETINQTTANEAIMGGINLFPEN